MYAQNVQAPVQSTVVDAAAAPMPSGGSRDEMEPPLYEFDYQGLFTNRHTSLEIDGNGIRGDTVDVKNELGLDNSYQQQFRFEWKPGHGRHALRFDFYRDSFDRTKTIDISFSLAGREFARNFTLESNLTTTTFGGYYAYRWGSNTFRAGPSVGIQVSKYSISLQSLDDPARTAAKDDFDIAAPVLGIDFESRPSKKIDLYGFGGAIGWSSIGRIGNVEAGIKVFPIDHLSLQAGVKYYNNVAKSSNNNLEAKLTYRIVGPFVGIGIWY
jgi:hypothetical protein